MTAIAEMEVTGVSPRVAKEIRRIYDSTGGIALASTVLAAAASDESPLHDYFTWDDSEAAEKYRMKQADDLIRRVRVRVIPADDSPPIQVRAYVSGRRMQDEGLDLGEESAVGRYLAIEAVAGHTQDEALMLAAIRRDLERLKAKYRGVQTLFAELVREVLVIE